MTGPTRQTPPGDTPWQGDIPSGDWIDRFVPAALRPYLRLMRVDRPIGTWLLLFPCWWSLALASDQWPDWWLMALFGVGALVMRGAGCTYNDIIDRDYDAQVARTRRRPIPSGAVTARQAAVWLGVQLVIGLVILLALNRAAILTGAASLLLVFSYPFMKRFTFWPQAWLGLAFNWGALLGWVAVTGRLGEPAVVLYIAGIAWTLAYDTIYALQDKEDDALAGIKSTALFLGPNTRFWVMVFFVITIFLLGTLFLELNLDWPCYPLLALAALLAGWQVLSLKEHEPQDCLSKFKSNRWFGWLILFAIIAGRVF